MRAGQPTQVRARGWGQRRPMMNSSRAMMAKMMRMVSSMIPPVFAGDCIRQEGCCVSTVGTLDTARTQLRGQLGHVCLGPRWPELGLGLIVCIELFGFCVYDEA